MGLIKWHKRDHSAALNGMMELTLEERGAYTTVLDLIYSKDGKLIDDDRFIAGWLRVDVRVWKRIKRSLISRNKLFVEDGIIRNTRADAEVLAALSRVGSAREAGLASANSKARKSNAKSSKNKHMRSTGAETTVSTTVSTNHNHNHKEEDKSSSTPPTPSLVLQANEVIDCWNAMADQTSEPFRVSNCRLTDKRRTGIKARLRDHSMDEIQQAIRRIPSSRFLTGDNDKGWVAHIDWLVTRSDSVTKILEGRYDDRPARQQSPRQSNEGTGAQRALARRIQARQAQKSSGEAGRYDAGESEQLGSRTIEGTSRDVTGRS